jgi:hypothetical protein
MSTEPAPPGKPTLALLRGNTITLDALLVLFRQLTGREPRPEERATAP